MKNSWKCVVRLNFFTKTCLTSNYFSRDPHFVILAWVQSWNIYEEFMKLCSPPEFFHKNMSHEQLLFTWSTLSDSRMGTKLKYFWKTHETLKSIFLSIASCRANNNQASTFEYSMPLVLIHPWNMHFSDSVFVIFKFRFMPANKTYLFMELTSFKSWFLVTFLASTLHRRIHLFVKFSC